MTEFESYLAYWSERSRAERERRDADAGDLYDQRGTGGQSPAESHPERHIHAAQDTGV
jgi:hypothetical protein